MSDIFFYVYGRADQNGMHAVKNEAGEHVLDVLDTEHNLYETLREEGYEDFIVETIFDETEWQEIGSRPNSIS